ncbi:MAG: UvrD-helicase domain-containing protein [Chitinivibrionales bacterium]|nr:UvrD-helicase domain-containing protein [Chitinivibrionales bacterium]
MIKATSGASILDTMVLNPVQYEAVCYDGGPQLVFAGAGTGKTRVLTAKIAFLIEQKKILPAQIFAATFTNKAAAEMRARLETVFGLPCQGLWIGTFHSLCARLLRRQADKLGFPASFTIYDSDDQVKLLKKILLQYKIDERVMTPRSVAGAISKFKNACVTPAQAAAREGSFYDREINRIYEAYQTALKKAAALDFDDLLMQSVLLLRNFGDVAAHYQDFFRYVLIDEYQDTNLAQFYFVKLLAARHNHVFAVGDDDQSIYGWRGAVVDNILSFEKHFTGTKIFTLEQNYRSTGPILSFANEAITPNVHRARKRLQATRPGGVPVVVSQYRDDRDEADAVADTLAASIAGACAAGEMAILFRTNAQSRVFEETLRKRKIAYKLVGGTSFYERKEIKDCLAYLRLLANPLDDISCERILNVPPRGLGEKTEGALLEYAGQKQKSLLQTICSEPLDPFGPRAQRGLQDIKSVFELLGEMNARKESPHEILNQMLTLTGYLDNLENDDSEVSENRIENVNELVNALTTWNEENPDKSLCDFLEEVSLVSDIDEWDKTATAVNLMTMHCAKGLEFKTVFLVGCEDGILPSRQNFDDERKIEEERRLFYVGITRAMNALYCSYALQRFRFGMVTPMAPSRFLRAIDQKSYTFIDTSSAYAPPPRSETPQFSRRDFAGPSVKDDYSYSQETVQYHRGQQVLHKVYGQGKILAINGFGADMRMTVLFTDGSRRKMIAKYAQLEIA